MQAIDSLDTFHFISSLLLLLCGAFAGWRTNNVLIRVRVRIRVRVGVGVGVGVGVRVRVRVSVRRARLVYAGRSERRTNNAISGGVDAWLG